MSVIIKYIVLCFSIIIFLTLTAVYIGNNDEAVKEEKKAQNQNQPDTSEQYRMYFSLEGDQFQIIDLMKGTAELNMVYSGKSKFTAKLLHSDGTLLTMLADVNGPYNRKQKIDVPETGPYLLDVRTSGEWSLSRQ